MDDDNDDKDDTKRKSRNLSEKKRRDQFNTLVNELSTLISSTNRKMDKSTVLKSTIGFLKHHNEIVVKSRVHEIQEDWKPPFLSNEEFTHLILEALDGFIIVFTSNGKIAYTSEGITSLLGHLPSDLLNMTMYDLAYELEHENIYNIFLNPTAAIDPLQTDLTTNNHISFHCHLKRGGLDYPGRITYELVKFVGYFRNDVDLDNMLPSNIQSRSGGLGAASDSDNSRLIFVGTGRIQTPQLIRELSIVDSSQNEFTSKHSLEWKFLFLDHRAPPIIGYLPFEVLGTSGYDYYHFDDLEKVLLSHESLIQKGEGKSCYYRFLTKGQQWIWLQTSFYITYHQWNSKPEFVVCTHQVVSYADVIKQTRNGHHSTFKDNNEISDDCIDRQYTKNVSPSAREGVSNWPSSHKHPRMSKHSIPTNVRRKMRYAIQNRGNESDSTSLSADSAASRHSMMTFSSQPKTRHSHPQTQQPQQTQKAIQLLPHQQISPQILPAAGSCQFSQPGYPIRAPHIVGHTFLEPPQYLTAIPVQPVIAPFPGTSVITTIPHSSEIIPGTVVMTSTQTQIQDQLQRKHDELQKLIIHQQEELRRVSEQLLLARYTLIQPVVPVSYDNNSPGTSRNSYGQQQQVLSEQYSFPMPSSSEHAQNQQHLQHQQQTLSSNPSRYDNLPVSHAYEQHPPPMHSTSAHHHHDDGMPSYMHLTSSSVSTPNYGHHHQPHIVMSEDGSETHSEHDLLVRHHHTNVLNHQQAAILQSQTQLPNELEVLPYQMSQEQSQILFDSPNPSGKR